MKLNLRTSSNGKTAILLHRLKLTDFKKRRRENFQKKNGTKKEHL
jgi:hypothetical protein